MLVCPTANTRSVVRIENHQKSMNKYQRGKRSLNCQKASLKLRANVLFIIEGASGCREKDAGGLREIQPVSKQRHGKKKIKLWL